MIADFCVFKSSRSLNVIKSCSSRSHKLEPVCRSNALDAAVSWLRDPIFCCLCSKSESRRWLALAFSLPNEFRSCRNSHLHTRSACRSARRSVCYARTIVVRLEASSRRSSLNGVFQSLHDSQSPPSRSSSPSSHTHLHLDGHRLATRLHIHTTSQSTTTDKQRRQSQQPPSPPSLL